ncbi:hypothetical protein [Halococcus sp. PRR34]|nr:hypothetical protein [Halococcus sp. PRR34]
MTDTDDSLDLSAGWGACEECGEDNPGVLRVGTLTDRRTLCRECRRENWR